MAHLFWTPAYVATDCSAKMSAACIKRLLIRHGGRHLRDRAGDGNGDRKAKVNWQAAQGHNGPRIPISAIHSQSALTPPHTRIRFRSFTGMHSSLDKYSAFFEALHSKMHDTHIDTHTHTNTQRGRHPTWDRQSINKRDSAEQVQRPRQKPAMLKSRLFELCVYAMLSMPLYIK